MGYSLDEAKLQEMEKIQADAIKIMNSFTKEQFSSLEAIGIELANNAFSTIESATTISRCTFNESFSELTDYGKMSILREYTYYQISIVQILLYRWFGNTKTRSVLAGSFLQGIDYYFENELSMYFKLDWKDVPIRLETYGALYDKLYGTHINDLDEAKLIIEILFSFAKLVLPEQDTKILEYIHFCNLRTSQTYSRLFSEVIKIAPPKNYKNTICFVVGIIIVAIFIFKIKF